jgi:hypothetical protein
LGDPNINTTVIIFENKAYQEMGLERSCYYWFDREKTNSLLDCTTFQNFLESLMLPYPIPEKQLVLNSRGYKVGWRKEPEGDFTFPDHRMILEKKKARNGELWIVGSQVPTGNPFSDWIGPTKSS